ncbi:MAG: flippase-like domain-containing protein [Clostridia bacterium]|nr:flippase-like domain-containing protein [Clostridia bacterium]
MDNDTKTPKNKIVKYILNMIVLVLLIALTFHILLKDQNGEELFAILKSAKLPFVLLGLLCMLLFYICESINMRRTLRALGEDCSMLMAMKYTLIGIFFSGITPAASGGQPLQVIYMKKDGIKVSSSTMALILNLFSFQVFTVGLALISLLFLHSYLKAGMIALFVIGVLLNSFSLAVIIIGIFSKRLSTILVNFVVKVMRKLKVKNCDAKEKAMNESLEKYNGSAQYIRSNKKIIIKQFTVGLLQQVLYYSVPFCVLNAFGLPMQNYFLMVGLQAMVFAMASGIPLPGAVGVSEGAFVSVYKPIFTEELISGAVILNRGISFYLPMIVCAVVVIVATLKSKKRK